MSEQPTPFLPAGQASQQALDALLDEFGLGQASPAAQRLTALSTDATPAIPPPDAEAHVVEAPALEPTAPAAVTPLRATPTTQPRSRRANQSRPAPSPVVEKADRFPAEIPASLYQRLVQAAEDSGLSLSARTLAALNTQRDRLADQFPDPLPAAPGPIPVRATPRRRRHLGEPSRTLTLYLTPGQAHAVDQLMHAVNAGSRSNLVTVALQLDLPAD